MKLHLLRCTRTTRRYLVSLSQYLEDTGLLIALEVLHTSPSFSRLSQQPPISCITWEIVREKYALRILVDRMTVLR